MIDRGSKVPLTRQAELLDLSRSRVYYAPWPLPAWDLRLMRRLDELHLKWPRYGASKLSRELQNEGYDIGRRLVMMLMRWVGMETIYRKQRTRVPARRAAITPYLLTIDRRYQVWGRI